MAARCPPLAHRIRQPCRQRGTGLAGSRIRSPHPKLTGSSTWTGAYVVTVTRPPALPMATSSQWSRPIAGQPAVMRSHLFFAQPAPAPPEQSGRRRGVLPPTYGADHPWFSVLLHNWDPGPRPREQALWRRLARCLAARTQPYTTLCGQEGGGGASERSARTARPVFW